MKRGRSASLPRDRPELDLSKWDPIDMGMEGTVGACSSLHAVSPCPDRAGCWWGLWDHGDRAGPGGPVGPSTAQSRSCRSGAQTHWIPPHFSLLCCSLRVRPLACQAPGHPVPTEEPWEPPRCDDISGTVHRWVPVAVGAGAEGQPPHTRWGPRLRSRWVLAGTRYQAGRLRNAPAPQEESGTLGCPRCHGSRTPSGEWSWGQPPAPSGLP